MNKYLPFRSTLIHQIRRCTRYADVPDTLIHQVRLYSDAPMPQNMLMLWALGAVSEVIDIRKGRNLWLDSLKRVTALFNGVSHLLLVSSLIISLYYSLIYYYLYGAIHQVRLYSYTLMLRYSYTLMRLWKILSERYPSGLAGLKKNYRFTLHTLRGGHYRRNK